MALAQLACHCRTHLLQGQVFHLDCRNGRRCLPGRIVIQPLTDARLLRSGPILAGFAWWGRCRAWCGECVWMTDGRGLGLTSSLHAAHSPL